MENSKREEYCPNYFVQSPSPVFDRSDASPLVLNGVINDFPGYSGLLEYSDKDWSYEDEKDELILVKSSSSSSSSSSSRWWINIVVQICWRFLFSFGVALLVFYIATQPPPPNFSLRIGGVDEFKLEEGVDSHGVTTKFLTCNCSINLLVDNNSNVFGLHIHPPSLNFFFGPFIFAKSQGPKLYADSDASTIFGLFIGTKDLAVYGAGREMDDMLKSRTGLSLILKMNIISDFRVVWNIINPKFHHKAQCLMRLAYDQTHKQVLLVKNNCRLVS